MSDLQQIPPRPPSSKHTTGAVYACDPDLDALRGMLAAAVAVAGGHGWTIADDGTIFDDCLLTEPPQARPGWDRVRGLAAQRRISFVVVPALGHIGFTWSLWQTEQRFLHSFRVSIVPVAPTLDAAKTGATR
ncbi:hypothetical protein ACF064_36380 [Streptomyces sp. NPDC015492]|uniref:hypothetical protein n=1 Tax=Streptomyces sp. NPDC015492 TaxID=3364958 RepID=UPI0036FFDD89